jgi:hypothetical protein
MSSKAKKEVLDTDKMAAILEEALTTINELKKENAALKAKRVGPTLTLKISSGKGVISLYGLGRYPVNLYASQWRTLIEEKTLKMVSSFLEDNKGKYAEKKEDWVAPKDKEGRSFSEAVNLKTK